jgi:hypothetical protein
MPMSANGDEHRADQAHQPRHPVALVAVADDRVGHHHQPGREHALHRAQHQQHREILDQRDQHRQHRVGRERQHQQRPASEPVGEGAGHQAADPARQQVDRDHQLAPVAFLGAELARHVVERRQHAVDGQRVEAHQQRDHHHQLALADDLLVAGNAGNRHRRAALPTVAMPHND